MTMELASAAFAAGERIPVRFTGDGEDFSPALSWTGVPKGTKQLTLLCDDPDAPTPEPWVHWLIYMIPAETTGLPENVAKTDAPPKPAGSRQGKNSWGKLGYGGPAPPRGHGLHHYHFRLYALDVELTLTPGQTKKDLLKVMKGHILAEDEFIGTYER